MNLIELASKLLPVIMGTIFLKHTDTECGTHSIREIVPIDLRRNETFSAHEFLIESNSFPQPVGLNSVSLPYFIANPKGNSVHFIIFLLYANPTTKIKLTYQFD